MIEEMHMLDYLRSKKNIGSSHSINVSKSMSERGLKKKPSINEEYRRDVNLTKRKSEEYTLNSPPKISQIIISSLLPYKREYQKSIFLSFIC